MNETLEFKKSTEKNLQANYNPFKDEKKKRWRESRQRVSSKTEGVRFSPVR